LLFEEAGALEKPKVRILTPFPEKKLFRFSSSCLERKNTKEDGPAEH